MSNYIPKSGGNPSGTIILVIGAAILGFVNGQFRKSETEETREIQERPEIPKAEDDGYLTYTLNSIDNSNNNKE